MGRKHSIGRLFLALGASIFLASCGDGVISSSFSPDATCDWTYVNPQPLEASFCVYVGGTGSIEMKVERLGDDMIDGYFAVQRSVADLDGNILDKEIVRVLDDFPDFEKYPLTYNEREGWLDYGEPVFEWYFVDTFDFSEIDEKYGKILYDLGYYDIGQDEFITDVYAAMEILVGSRKYRYFQISGERVVITEEEPTFIYL